MKELVAGPEGGEKGVDESFLAKITGNDAQRDFDKQVEQENAALLEGYQMAEGDPFSIVPISAIAKAFNDTPVSAFVTPRLADPSPQNALEFWIKNIVGRTFYLPNGLRNHERQK